MNEIHFAFGRGVEGGTSACVRKQRPRTHGASHRAPRMLRGRQRSAPHHSLGEVWSPLQCLATINELKSAVATHHHTIMSNCTAHIIRSRHHVRMRAALRTINVRAAKVIARATTIYADRACTCARQ
jgi:hypothetical protein